MKDNTYTIEIDPLLELFLLVTGHYDRFMKNTMDVRDLLTIDYIDEVYKGFKWMDSPEGSAYWVAINAQFEEYKNNH